MAQFDERCLVEAIDDRIDGIGGQKNWSAESADPAADETVTFVNEELGFFETEGGRYFFDADDVFQTWDGAACENAAQHVFEQNLSAGDVLLADGTTYVPSITEPAGNSTFCIDDVARVPAIFERGVATGVRCAPAVDLPRRNSYAIGMNPGNSDAARTATVSEKGQITIPQALRRRLNIKPGEVLEVLEERGQLVVRRRRRRDPLDEVFGVLELDTSVDELVEEMRGPLG